MISSPQGSGAQGSENRPPNRLLWAGLGAALFAVAAMAVAAFFFLVAKDEQSDTLKVVKVQVVDYLTGGYARSEIDKNQIQQELEKQVSSDSHFVLYPKERIGDVYLMKLVLQDLDDATVEKEGVKGVKSRVQIDLKLNRIDGSAGDFISFAAKGSAEGFTPAGESKGGKITLPHRELMGKAIERALTSLVEQSSSENFTVEKLLASLEDPSPSVRAVAVEELGRRKEPRAVEPLIKMLNDPSAKVSGRALGALSELGDPRAVDPIVDRADLSDTVDMLEIIGVVGRLGGPEAIAFLNVVATGHSDPTVRREARKFFDRLMADTETGGSAQVR